MQLGNRPMCLDYPLVSQICIFWEKWIFFWLNLNLSPIRFILYTDLPEVQFMVDIINDQKICEHMIITHLNYEIDDKLAVFDYTLSRYASTNITHSSCFRLNR